MEKYFYRYLPTGIVCVALIFQYNIFVTPEKLEVKHREIMNEISMRYETKEQSANLEAQMSSLMIKVDKIYEILMDRSKK